MSAFQFYTPFQLIMLLGKKARNPVELLEHIKTVPDSSIYYHTHRFLRQHHYLSPEPTNDFAYWLTNVLNLKKLGESFAGVNMVSLKELAEIRSSFILLLENFLKGAERLPDCPEGEEFHFMGCVTFLLPAPDTAHDLGQFAAALEKISIDSFYYHVFEARLQPGGGQNDFSTWLESIGETAAAQEIRRFDPYHFTLDGLRKKILTLLRRYDQH